MKAPPCMRWRGLHLAFVAKAARFLGRIFTSRPFTESSDHLKRQLPDAPPRNHVPARFLPQFRSFLGAFRLGDVSFLLPPSEYRKGFDQRFQDIRNLHSPIHRTRKVIPRPDELLHRLSTPTRSDQETVHTATAARPSTMLTAPEHGHDKPAVRIRGRVNRLVSREARGAAAERALEHVRSLRRPA